MRTLAKNMMKSVKLKMKKEICRPCSFLLHISHFHHSCFTVFTVLYESAALTCLCLFKMCPNYQILLERKYAKPFSLYFYAWPPWWYMVGGTLCCHADICDCVTLTQWLNDYVTLLLCESMTLWLCYSFILLFSNTITQEQDVVEIILTPQVV